MVAVARAVHPTTHRMPPHSYPDRSRRVVLWQRIVAWYHAAWRSAPVWRATVLGLIQPDDAQLPLVPAPKASQLTAGSTSAPGDQSFGDFFLQHRLALVEYICGMTRDRDWATDLAQDTFVRAFAARQTLAGVANPRAWLYRIATNLTLNALRHQRHFTWLPLGHVEPEAGPDDSSIRAVRPTLPPLALPTEDVAVAVTERDAVWSVLSAMPPRWRAVLLLQTTSGFSVDEIAALLHLSEANVRKILYRAKERFRETYLRMSAHATAQASAQTGG